MQPANESPRYRKFIDARNRALEEILNKYLTRIDKIIAGLEIVTKEIVSYSVDRNQASMAYIDQRLSQAFSYAAGKVTELTKQLRADAYLLSYAGEVEAIARTMGTPATADISKAKIGEEENEKETPSGGSLQQRMSLYLSRLRRRVLDAIELGLVRGESGQSMGERIESAFPRKRKIKKPKRVIKPRKLTEAKPPTKKPDNIAITTGFIDDQAWDDLVQDYIGRVIPSRGPEDILTTAAKGLAGERYAWEVEQEITQDFITKVRKGQVDAANENGIEEFVWIAVVDSVTDKCCLWRDGKTTTEIEKLLKGEHSGDKCKVSVPPAHFNCRCDLAPMIDIPDTTPQDLGDFETWLA